MFSQLFLALCVALLTRLLWWRWKYDLHKIPSSPGLPILGHTVEFSKGQAGKQFSNWFRRHYYELGFPKLFRARVGFDDWIFVTDSETIRTVINNRTNPFPRHPLMKKMAHPMISKTDKGESMISSDDKEYVRRIRTIYTTAFQNSQLRKKLPSLIKVMDGMIRIVEDKRQQGPIDFQKLSVLFTLDSIGEVAFDANLGGMDGTRKFYQSIIDAGYVARMQISNPVYTLFCTLFPNTQIAKERSEKLDKLKTNYDKLLYEILSYSDPPEDDKPLWYNMRNLGVSKDSNGLSNDALRAEVATVIFAGMDTLGHQLTWILGLIATHPEIADNLIEEFQNIGIDTSNPRDVSFEQLGQLPYLNAVIKEGFRLAYALTFSIFRRVPKDMTILGYRFPKDTLIAIPSNQSVNTEAEWGDPDVVRPERWLMGDDLSANFFEMFHTGPRDCLGQRLAMMEIRLVVIILVSKYHLSSDLSFSELLQNSVDGVLMEAKDGMWIHVKPRIDSTGTEA